MLQRSHVYALLVCFATTFISFLTPTAFAGEVSLIWNPNSESDIKGYNVYMGMQSGMYDAPQLAYFFFSTPQRMRPSQVFKTISSITFLSQP